MKKKLLFKTIGTALLSTFCISCAEKREDKNTMTSPSKKVELENEKPKHPLSNDFKQYWYAGDAEVTSYALEQARYGELRDGHAVLIYVTEPFLPEKQVKADQNKPENISVLKLNAAKNFITGIYPYSILSSTFYPVHDNQHAIKTSLSVQEWCGHVYSQINNRDTFEFISHSYFEKEADQEFDMEKGILENEIWTKIRINPEGLPLGQLKVIPSLEFLRLQHKEAKTYQAEASISTKDGITTYSLAYPELERKLQINFSVSFPHSVESWTEETRDGFGANAKLLITSAKKIKTLKTAYWGQHGNNDLFLRDSLGL